MLLEQQGRIKLVFGSGRAKYVSRNQKEGLHIATSVPGHQDVFEFGATYAESLRFCRILVSKAFSLQ